MERAGTIKLFSKFHSIYLLCEEASIWGHLREFGVSLRPFHPNPDVPPGCDFDLLVVSNALLGWETFSALRQQIAKIVTRCGVYDEPPLVTVHFIHYEVTPGDYSDILSQAEALRNEATIDLSFSVCTNTLETAADLAAMFYLLAVSEQDIIGYDFAGLECALSSGRDPEYPDGRIRIFSSAPTESPLPPELSQCSSALWIYSCTNIADASLEEIEMSVAPLRQSMSEDASDILLLCPVCREFSFHRLFFSRLDWFPTRVPLPVELPFDFEDIRKAFQPTEAPPTES